MRARLAPIINKLKWDPIEKRPRSQQELDGLWQEAAQIVVDTADVVDGKPVITANHAENAVMHHYKGGLPVKPAPTAQQRFQSEVEKVNRAIDVIGEAPDPKRIVGKDFHLSQLSLSFSEALIWFTTVQKLIDAKLPKVG